MGYIAAEVLNGKRHPQRVAKVCTEGRWTAEEHNAFLRSLVAMDKGDRYNDWKRVSEYFLPTRTPVQVSNSSAG